MRNSLLTTSLLLVAISASISYCQDRIQPIAGIESTLDATGKKQALPQPLAPAATLVGSSVLSPDYVLGPADQFSLFEADLDEISNKPFRVDLEGNVDMPLLGRIHAAGQSVKQFKLDLNERLKQMVKNPDVLVTMLDFRSQPVTVLGEVTTPGVYQVQGHMTLFQMLSLAGGPRPDAGGTLRITRDAKWGPIPLPGAHEDPTGHFSVALIPIKAVLNGVDPLQNILVMPEDVISVPRAEIVYAVGAVVKPGGYLLNNSESMSALQVIALSEGFSQTASPGSARILRVQPSSTARLEIPVNLKEIQSGKSPDLPLRADDILFIPTSKTKVVSQKTVGALITLTTGMVVYGKY
jgi:polysaccharide export outer membrane protein